ncbi:uncharacterized protein LOC122250902 [Penaeus japonicus]|uniref:uncharacterized protein LOC122250902 n=1 Tax=Penaeus japonicus TaxID=27405 RepID=UPI001C70E957|nr:uncharacterized protein LOC122250902 [Penaeus japonicus]
MISVIVRFRSHHQVVSLGRISVVEILEIAGKGIVTPGDIETQGTAGTREETQEDRRPETPERDVDRDRDRERDRTTAATQAQTPGIHGHLVLVSNKTRTSEVEVILHLQLVPHPSHLLGEYHHRQERRPLCHPVWPARIKRRPA